LHNTTGPADYTWRNDFSIFEPGRLDYVLYTDSVARVANSFVLNTVAMTAAELSAAGLQTYDVTINALEYDHLPLVADFRFLADGKQGDYNLDRVVDTQGYDLWQQSYGSASNHDADVSQNNVVDASVYVVWRKFSGFAGGSFMENGSPIPEPASNLLLPLFGVVANRRKLRSEKRLA
jgi:hypothetical protein